MECCEFTGPLKVGDAAATIVIHSGSPDSVDGMTIYAEGCDCGYVDTYVEDGYCDPTESGAFPQAFVTDQVFTVSDMPANAILTIDSAERLVTLTDSTGVISLGGVNALEWLGLFEWLEAAGGACMKICIDSDGADVNADTTVEVLYHDREL